MDINNEIVILQDYPAILTKDSSWARTHKPNMSPGAILVLPKDAVLVIPTMTVSAKDYTFDLLDSINLASPTKETTQEKAE